MYKGGRLKSLSVFRHGLKNVASAGPKLRGSGMFARAGEPSVSWGSYRSDAWVVSAKFSLYTLGDWEKLC